MTWIATIPYGEATGKLKTIYDRVKGPDDNVDNIMLAHSLRPHTLEGHMTLYKYVLHHSANKMPKWVLEAIGTWVSMLNNCSYCVDHHFQGLARLLGDAERAGRLRAAFETGSLMEAEVDDQVRGALAYARKLTLDPASLKEADIGTLRQLGLDDGEILEINQVTAYFSYANRTVLGLGVNTDGDIIGLSPGDNADPDNWGHA